jgi:uncharacterized protein (TIGR03083 family)
VNSVNLTAVPALATRIDWPAARAAVAEAAPRFSDLIRSARKPDAPALGQWDVTEVAQHVSHAADVVLAVSQGGGNLLEDIWDMPALTRVMVAGEGHRPLGEIADRLDESVARLLAAMEAADGAGDDAVRTWLVAGTEMPPSSLTCHVLNELTVHGWDIARAEGVRWPIERSHAAMIVDGFVYPSLHTLGGAMVSDVGAGKRARFEVRLRGGTRSWLHFDDGDFSVETSPQGPVDCHLSVDPEAYLLVAWGRISQWPAIGKGKMLAWGRKPWLGPQLRSWLRNP